MANPPYRNANALPIPVYYARERNRFSQSLALTTPIPSFPILLLTDCSAKELLTFTAFDFGRHGGPNAPNHGVPNALTREVALANPAELRANLALGLGILRTEKMRRLLQGCQYVLTPGERKRENMRWFFLCVCVVGIRETIPLLLTTARLRTEAADPERVPHGAPERYPLRPDWRRKDGAAAHVLVHHQRRYGGRAYILNFFF